MKAIALLPRKWRSLFFCPKPQSKSMKHNNKILRAKACTLLKVPLCWVIDVMPNCGHSAYFVHLIDIQLNNRHKFRTEIVTASNLEAVEVHPMYQRTVSSPHPFYL